MISRDPVLWALLGADLTGLAVALAGLFSMIRRRRALAA